MDYHTLDAEVVLKLKDMDRYIPEVEALPPALRERFERGGCLYCGFQGATREFCKFRVRWTLDGRAHDACGFAVFTFANPDSALVPWLCRLMALEYGLPA